MLVAVLTVVALALSPLALGAAGAEAARNKAPKLKPIAGQTVLAGRVLTVRPRAKDPDHGPRKLRFSTKGRPAWLHLSKRSGRMSGRAPLSAAGHHWRIVLRVTDGKASRSRAFTVRVPANKAPRLAALSDRTLLEGARLSTRASGTDPDHGPLPLRYSISYRALAGSPARPAWLALNPSTGSLVGTAPQGSAGDGWTATVSVTDGLGRASRSFKLKVVAPQPGNHPPVIGSIDPTTLSGTVGESLSQVVTVDATDEDGDDLALDVTGLPAGLDATDNGDGTVTVAGTPTAAGDTTASVTATDPDDASDSADLEISVVDKPARCTPRSPLSCAEIPVDLPYSLTFDGAEGGLGDTGFTMVDPPSHPRDNVDQAPAPTAPSDPDVPGYEPSLVNTTGGNLGLTATRGIMYRDPAGSAGTNSQLNALGVGVAGGDHGYEVETTVVAPTFPSSGTASGSNSQQGGLWFGLGEDDYVKAAVVRVTSTTNKVQLVVESDATATPATTYELNSAPFPADQDVRLVLRADDTTGDGGAVSLRYAVNGGSLTQLTDAANTVDTTTLPIPQDLFDGVALGDGAGQASFAGLYTTKRSAAATDDITVDFADFEVRELPAPDTTAPAAPKNLAATVADDAVELTWDANDEADLAGYRVFRATSAGVPTDGAPISGSTPITGTSFTDETAAGGTTYHYVVVAVDESGNASAGSNEVTATVETAPRSTRSTASPRPPTPRSRPATPRTTAQPGPTPTASAGSPRRASRAPPTPR